MRILIDTQILIWYVEGNNRLSTAHRQLIESDENVLCVSLASFWEMAIKISINKLKLNCPLENFLPEKITLLPINFNHILQVQTLPFHHTDPFDRLIICQAIEENLVVMSVDEHFSKYPVALV
jgi:PIN domain nuclease of toxin-antitoxin system